MIDTIEKRRAALDFAQIRGTGMPIPTGMTSGPTRAHILNLYFEAFVPVSAFFWRNKNIIGGVWVGKNVPVGGWQRKASPATAWTGRIPPPDSSTQEI